MDDERHGTETGSWVSGIFGEEIQRSVLKR